MSQRHKEPFTGCEGNPATALAITALLGMENFLTGDSI